MYTLVFRRRPLLGSRKRAAETQEPPAEAAAEAAAQAADAAEAAEAAVEAAAEAAEAAAAAEAAEAAEDALEMELDEAEAHQRVEKDIICHMKKCMRANGNRIRQSKHHYMGLLFYMILVFSRFLLASFLF